MHEAVDQALVGVRTIRDVHAGRRAVAETLDREVTDLGHLLAARGIDKLVDRLSTIKTGRIDRRVTSVTNPRGTHERDLVGGGQQGGISQHAGRQRTVAVERALTSIFRGCVDRGITGVLRRGGGRHVVVTTRKLPRGGKVRVVTAVVHGLIGTEIRRAGKLILGSASDRAASVADLTLPTNRIHTARRACARRIRELLVELRPIDRIEALRGIRILAVHKVGHPANLREVAVAELVVGARAEPAFAVGRREVHKTLTKTLQRGTLSTRLGGVLDGGQVGEQQARQDADDRDDHQQLDEGKTLASVENTRVSHYRLPFHVCHKTPRGHSADPSRVGRMLRCECLVATSGK